MTFLERDQNGTSLGILAAVRGCCLFFKANKTIAPSLCVFVVVVERWQNSENAASPLK